MADATPPPFYTRYGFSRTGDPTRPLVIQPDDAVCRNGVLRATVVAAAIDLVGGLETRARAGVDATFTSDLSLRIPAPRRPPRLVARARVLRAGRRLVTTRVVLEAEDGTRYAEGVTTFVRIARDPADVGDPAALATPVDIPAHPLARPLAEEVGVEHDTARPGRVVLPMRDALRNPEGVMQGALVALLVEEAALAAATGPAAVSGLDLRYLAPAATGPIEAIADTFDPRGAGALRVDLFDRGHADRMTATAWVDVTAPPEDA